MVRKRARVYWLVVALSPGMAMSLQLQTRLVGIFSALFTGERGRYIGECRQCWVRGAAAAWKGSAGESAEQHVILDCGGGCVLAAETSSGTLHVIAIDDTQDRF